MTTASIPDDVRKLARKIIEEHRQFAVFDMCAATEHAIMADRAQRSGNAVGEPGGYSDVTHEAVQIMRDRAAPILAAAGPLELIDGFPVPTPPPGEVEKLREALELAEDILSRSPMSSQMWSTKDGDLHPQIGITKIRAALKENPNAR